MEIECDEDDIVFVLPKLIRKNGYNYMSARLSGRCPPVLDKSLKILKENGKTPDDVIFVYGKERGNIFSQCTWDEFVTQAKEIESKSSVGDLKTSITFVMNGKDFGRAVYNFQSEFADQHRCEELCKMTGQEVYNNVEQLIKNHFHKIHSFVQLRY